MPPMLAVLNDEIYYMRIDTRGNPGSIGVAVPKNGNYTFLVILLGLPTGTEVHPEDLDWVVLDETRGELKPIGFGTPLEFPQGPTQIMMYGRLSSGCVTLHSKSDLTVIALIFVVSKEIDKVTLLVLQRKVHEILSEVSP